MEISPQMVDFAEPQHVVIHPLLDSDNIQRGIGTLVDVTCYELL